jgi:hypothetical protein
LTKMSFLSRHDTDQNRGRFGSLLVCPIVIRCRMLPDVKLGIS